MALAGGDLGSANGRSGLEIARHGPGMLLAAAEARRAESVAHPDVMDLYFRGTVRSSAPDLRLANNGDAPPAGHCQSIPAAVTSSDPKRHRGVS